MTHAKGATTIADLQYQFNAVNNITQIIDAAGTHNYSYDSLDRLTTATHPSQTNESYTYDDVGNRTASHQGSSYTYQPFNRLTAANGNSYGYDTNGNLTSKTDTIGSWTYSWDYENRLKQAALAGGVTVSYSYDPLGRRIQRSDSNASTSKFVYDGPDVVRDLNANLTTAADYVNGPGIDNKLRQTITGTASYFIQDHLGTTRGLTDSSGNVTASVSYDSFGNVTSGSASTRYTYTGRESDSDTGLMYYRARSYDRWTGRFISEDPIEFKGGINLYAYTLNNPINYSDPLGLELDAAYRAMHPAGRGQQGIAGNTDPNNVSIFRLLWDFVTGTGPRERSFGADDDMTSGLRTSPDVAWHRAWWCSEGKGPYKNKVHEQFGFGAYDGPWRAGLNGPRQFVGTFNMTIIELPNDSAIFVARNTTSLPSLLYHIPGVPELTDGGPFSNTDQTFSWTEDCVCARVAAGIDLPHY